jgi:hypothetical protein
LTSFAVYLTVVIVLVGTHVALTLLPVDHVMEAQQALSSWPSVVVFTLLGLAGTWLAYKTGFPEIWEVRGSTARRLLPPVLFGAISGAVLAALVNLVVQLPGQIHIPFPTSLLFYTYGGIESEILLRLFLLPLFVWLISSVLLKGRFQDRVFWSVAIVLSLLEPLMQLGGMLQMNALETTPLLYVALLLIAIYGINLLSAAFFRRSGFLAPLAVRLSLYLVWHVIIGAVV